MSANEKRLQSLHDAVKSNNLEQVKALLDSGVNPNKLHRSHESPVLFYACEQYNLEMVRLLITHPRKPANPNKRGKWGRKKLQGRMVMGRLCHEYLILYIIGRQRAHYKKVRLATLLLKEALIKVDVNVETEWYGTPLPYAVCENNMEMVELLVSAGADINHATLLAGERVTPLMQAFHSSTVQMSKFLVEYGCEVNMEVMTHGYESYFSALHSAARRDCTSHDQSLSRVKYLIEEVGANLFVCDGTVIEIAIAWHNNVLLDYLLQRAYQVYGDNTCWGNTSIPIEIAIEAQSESCVALLLHWGTMRPEALFQTATYYGCLKTLQLLAKMYPPPVRDENEVVINSI